MKKFRTKAQSFTQRHKEGRKDQRRRRTSLRLCVKLCAFVRNCFYVFSLLSLITLSTLAQSPEIRGLAELNRGDYDNAFKLLSAQLV